MTKAMHNAENRLAFFLSENKVILTEGLADGSIPAAYFRYVIDF